MNSAQVALLLNVVLAAACSGGDSATPDAAPPTTDASPDGTPDATPDATSPLIPTTACVPTGMFQVGTPPVASLLVTEAGGVIHATYPAVGGGYWVTANRVNGQVVTAPRRIDSTLTPTALAVNGDRLLVAGGDQVQAVTTAGDAVAPPHAVPCPTSGISCGRHLVAGPADRFRITWDIPCPPGIGCRLGVGTAAARVLDRDGVPVTAAEPSNAYRFVEAAVASNGTATILTEHNAVVGGCVACLRVALNELSPAGTVSGLGDLPAGEFDATAGGSITSDGTRTYVAWRAAVSTGVSHRIELGRGLTSLDVLPDAEDVRLVATAPSTGGLVFSDFAGAAALTRFRDQPGVDAIDRAGACRLPAWPAALVRADPDHVVTIDATGLARIYALP